MELKQDAVTLLSLRHTNLMSYFGIGYDTHSVCMCVEFIQGETLLSIINRQVTILDFLSFENALIFMSVYIIPRSGIVVTR